MSRARRLKFGTVAMVLQSFFVLMFAFLAEYDVSAKPEASDTDASGARLEKKYPPFQDVHVMIFLGIGFLLTFLKRYGYSAVGLNMFLGTMMIQWAMIVRGFLYQGVFSGNKFSVVLDEMVAGDFAAATVLISFCVVLGKTSPLQLMVMGIIEIVFAQFNGWLCHEKLHAVDLGESMYIHAFAAYFGLGVSRMLYNKHMEGHAKLEPSYHADLFSFVGTIFLWCYWPSFNGGGADQDEQHRAYINTYLSLCACTISSFAFSAFYDKDGKFTPAFIQNATLAGGVVVGTTANMPLQPFGAILLGCLAGIICVTGFRFISAWMASHLKIQDTCGVHNLHGMPGILAAISGAVMAAISSEESWGRSKYEIFPATVPEVNTTDYANLVLKHGFQHLAPGNGWSSTQQGGYQFLALIVTIVIASVSGLLTGLILRLPMLDPVTEADALFEDSIFWNVPSDGMPAVEDEDKTNMEGVKLQSVSKSID